MNREYKYEIRNGKVLQHFGEDGGFHQKPLFDNIVFKQKKVDLQKQIEIFNNWRWDNSEYNHKRIGYDVDTPNLIPNCLELVNCYTDYSVFSYLNKGILIMNLQFDRNHQNTKMNIKEWVIKTTYNQYRNGELTQSPFEKISLDWDSKKEKHLSMEVWSKPNKEIIELYERYSKKDNEYLTKYYMDNFSVGKEFIKTNVEVW